MPTPLLIAIILIVCCSTSAYVTARICNNDSESEWQVIRYSGSSVEPKDIYICKRCNNKKDVAYHYCDNCGARMTNGVYHVNYPDEIDLSE